MEMIAKARIMIAEDEGLAAMVLEEELRALGYEVMPTVSSGEDAVNAAANLKPDLILMDIILKGSLDGISAAEKIHTTLDIPVVYLTAHTDEDVLRKAMVSEPLGYIVKPCDRKTLQSIIETALNKYHMAIRLKESEERYRDLFENAHDLIQSVTPGGRLKYVNRAWRETLGYLEDDVEDLSLLNIIHPESIEHCMGIFQRVLSGEAADDIWAAFITKDGRKVLVEGSATCKLENGLPVYTRWILRDVTERKRSEEQILTQRDLAIALVEAGSLSDALRACLQSALRVSGMDCGGIYLLDGSGDLRLAYAEGLSKDFLDMSSHYKACSDNWRMALSGSPVYSRYDDLDTSVQIDKNPEGLQAVAVIPIIHTGRTIGCFNMASHSLDIVPAFSRSALEAITAQVGNAIARLQAEEALHDSKVELQSIFDSMQDFLFVLDSEGKILRANKAAIERLGYSEDELRGMYAIDIHAPEHRDGAGQVIADMIAGRRDVCPIPLQAKDGTRIPVETKVTLERWDDRAVLIGISRDVSERLRIEDALRKSEARYRAIVEDQTELICRFKPDGTLTFVNETYCRYFRMSVEDLIGNSFSPIIPEEDKILISDRHSSISIDRPVTSYDHRVIAPEGIRWMQWTARGIFDCEGSLLEIQSAGRDITDKMNAQEALRASEEHFRTLTLSSPAGIFRADSQGWCTYVNDRWCEITGLGRSDVLGYDWTNGIFSEDLGRVEDALEQLSADDLPFKIEFRVQRPDETVAWVLVQIMVERGPSGKVAGYIGTYTDITYLKRLEADLCRANEVLEHKVEDKTAKLIKASSNLGRAYQDLVAELSERKRSEEIREVLVRELEFKNAEMESFLYTVSHDLRTPLITVSGFVGLIKSDLSKGNLGQALSDLDVISSAVAKMDTLLLDTLELSRIGRIANPPDIILFEDIVRGALCQVGDMVKIRKVQVTVEPGVPRVNVDHMRIEEALVNMIDNSIKYMGNQPHPEILIGFRQSDGAFFIKDNGMGIDPSQHHKVFELFYKVDRKSDGPGAGLAIVKRIVEVHGGRIWIESESGKGCTVCFTLPLNVD